MDIYLYYIDYLYLYYIEYSDNFESYNIEYL